MVFMRRTRLALVAIAVLAAAAPALAQTPALPNVIDTKVAVISTGTGAKRPLRYKPVAGAKERLDLKMAMGLTMEMPGMGAQSMPAPSMTMAIDMDVASISPAGDISVTMTVPSATMEGEGLPAGMLDPVKGLSAAIVMDGRGMVKSMKFDESKITDPMMKQLVSQSGLDRLSMPLPEEPMGVGGKWQVTQAIEGGGIKLDQISTFEVVELNDTSATFNMTISQSAAPQTVALPGMPGGVEASLAGMTGTGGGRMTLADGALALTGEMNMKSSMTMDVNAGGQSQRIGTSTDMKMTLARGKRQ